MIDDWPDTQWVGPVGLPGRGGQQIDQEQHVVMPVEYIHVFLYFPEYCIHVGVKGKMPGEK